MVTAFTAANYSFTGCFSVFDKFNLTVLFFIDFIRAGMARSSMRFECDDNELKSSTDVVCGLYKTERSAVTDDIIAPASS